MFVTKILKASTLAQERELQRLENSPGPTSYNTSEAFHRLESKRIQHTVSKTKLACVFDTPSKSPGPCEHTTIDVGGTLDWVSLGISFNRKRL